MSIKKSFDKVVQKAINTLAQSSVEEIDDGLQSSDEVVSLCRQAVAEGCVLLKNKEVLPLGQKRFALFGRCQINTFYVGYGSGGDVKPPYRVSILEGLKDCGANLDDTVASAYQHWTKENAPNEGFWGHWPMYYDEMPVSEQFVSDAAKSSEVAVVVIGRAAGEDRENKEESGSWFLTREEENLLSLVRKYFKKVCVIVNAGSIMDVSGIGKYNIDALMFVWQGGQETGHGIADVLLGKISPSGRLTDTIARIEDYPSYKYFGGKKFNEYVEDIYVGYRYFNTFAEDNVIYPFGFGLSYTKFDISDCAVKRSGDTTFDISFCIKNIGSYSGKDVVQLYLSSAQGKLGKPKKELCAFFKTKTLEPNQVQECSLSVDLKDFASFDDSGKTGHKNCFVLEGGQYRLFIGDNVIDNKEIASVFLDETVVRVCQEACAPKDSFKRMVNASGLGYEDVPTATVDLRKRILEMLPESVTKGTAEGTLQDVIDGKITLDDFVAQLTPEELEAITRGSLHGMDSPYGPKGNAGTFGANCQSLFDKGILAISTDDGPSGVRLQAHSTLLPNGVALASTFNEDLVKKLTFELGKEVIERKSNVILAPGMNIHRNPLCGRNFEYFSEDPYLTGRIATAYILGVQSSGASATPKHFACNNQETCRSTNDSRVSQRALREIYLKGFEMCIRGAKPDCIMTSYNKLNGVWSYYNYDLATTILRQEWGYDGCVMTDWWIKSAKSKDFGALETHAIRIRAQVDVFMPGSESFGSHKDKSDGTVLRSLGSEDGLTIAELQRSAKNVLRLCMKHMKKR